MDSTVSHQLWMYCPERWGSSRVALAAGAYGVHRRTGQAGLALGSWLTALYRGLVPSLIALER